MHLVRHLVQMVCAYAAAHRGGVFSADALPKEDVRALAAWEAGTRAWPLVLDPEQAAASAGDLSSLYLREYALELVRKTQFPISSSLPWILAAHAARARSPLLLPAAVLPLLVYNQAGRRAVTELRRTHLLREVVAETDIAYDQLVWKLARRLVMLAKVAAAADLFEQRTPGFPRRSAAGECAGLEQAARQAEVHLVGEAGGDMTTRVRALRQLVGRRVLALVGQGVHYALLRFEAEGLGAAEELAALLAAHRLALARLAAAGVAVGPAAEAWRGVWREAAEGGERVCRQVTLELFDDLFPCSILHYPSATFVPLPAHHSSRSPDPHPAPARTAAGPAAPRVRGASLHVPGAGRCGCPGCPAAPLRHAAGRRARARGGAGAGEGGGGGQSAVAGHGRQRRGGRCGGAFIDSVRVAGRAGVLDGVSSVETATEGGELA